MTHRLYPTYCLAHIFKLSSLKISTVNSTNTVSLFLQRYKKISCQIWQSLPNWAKNAIITKLCQIFAENTNYTNIFDKRCPFLQKFAKTLGNFYKFEIRIGSIFSKFGKNNHIWQLTFNSTFVKMTNFTYSK